MPITGTFEADFSQFSSATQAATEDLKGLQTTATTTTTQITGLEQATKTTATSAGTLASSWRSFDGALSAVGVHIGPQVQGLIDIGNAAGKTSTELGALATAGLVVSSAMAGWNFGRWIAGITGADQAIVNLTDRLLGTGLAAQTAGAQQDAIDLAFTRTGVHATSAAQALQLNTQWLKDNAAQAKQNAADAKAQAKADKEWSDQIAQDAKRRAAEEKAALEAAAAARRIHDAELIDGYNKRIGAMKEIEAAQAGHYGVEGQIALLQQLAANEDTLTKATYTQLDSEKDRMKVIEANNKRQTEIEIEIGKVRDEQTRTQAESTLRAVGLQTELNKAYGLDAKGAILLPQDAMSEYQKKIDTINGSMKDGAEKTAALALANKQLEDSFLADAKAADTSAVAIQGTTAAVKTAQQVATDRANASLGGGTLGAGGGASSPDISGYMAQGYSLGEALAIALGHGEHIIGQSSGQLAKISGGAFGRAIGGPVTAGGAYVVGERGPELFSPAVNGSISPSLGGGGISIVIQGSVLSTQAELAALVERAMLAAYRRGGNRLPV